jgi:serine/threonine protein kinase
VQAPEHIGRYEIREQLGAGGMGAVYRAWDPRLHREVALKLLPSEVAQDQTRRRRFLEEARAVGALTHPNIVAAHDADIDHEFPFIVTELVDGRRLRDEMFGEPMPTRRLLDLAVQIAAGLNAAHAIGITHRDLKPENVMVTRDGRVKIVDFGLARIVAPEPAEAPARSVTTVSLSALAGTPQYMSPEQAGGGEALDFRSDQFSFGVVLYEMATGTHPFRRATLVETMSAVITDEAAPIARLNPKVPAPLRWIIERCLAKDRIERYASTADLLKDLTTLQSRLSEITAEGLRPIEPSAAPRRTGSLPLVAAVLLLAVVVSLLLTSGAGDLPIPDYRPLVTASSFQTAPALSPDGTTLAYVSQVDGILEIFTTGMDFSSEPQRLTSGRRFDSTDPFWSPTDNSRVYYHAPAGISDALWAVAAAGGTPEPWIENAARSTISRDGRSIVFFRDDTRVQNPFALLRALHIASADGTNVRRYTEAPFDTRTFVEGALRFSPDGTKLLAWVWGWPDTSATRPVPVSEFWMIPWPPGGKPYRVLESLESGAPAPVSFDWLDDRRIVIALWEPTLTRMHLWEADTVSGGSRQITAGLGSESRPVVTSDRGRIVFASDAVDFDLVEIPLDGAPGRPMLATQRNESDPSFAEDGSQYAFLSDHDGALRIQSRPRNGNYSRTIVSADNFPDRTLAFGSLALSPNGGRIAYQRYGGETGYQVWYSTTGGRGPHVRISSGAFYQDGPAWSPEGDRLAFTERMKDTRLVIRVKQVGTDQEPQIVHQGPVVITSRVKWSPDGQWILFKRGDGLAIVRPDGSDYRTISEEAWMEYEWSADSRLVYGLRNSDDRAGHFLLAGIDIATGNARIINPDLGVVPVMSQGLRGLTRSSSGTLVTSLASARSTIDMLTNFARRRSWFPFMRSAQ